MSAAEEHESPPEATTPKHHRKLSPLWWAALALVLVALVLRFGFEYGSHGKSEELVKEVAGLADRAQKAKEVKDLAVAKQSLSQAIMLLRDAEQFKAHPVYISTLLDMGALLLSARSPGQARVEEVAEGRRFLTEAWEVAKGLDARTRWRIARDLGLGAILAGDMAEAEKWYSIATELVPEDSVSKDRLATLRNAKKWK